MKIDKIELEEILEELEKHKGKHTELISVYIPAGYDVNSVQRQLEAEKSTAKNIKSTATRKNVADALDKIVRHLKTLKKTPENGLALFCGNVAQAEGQNDLQLWDIEPYMPLKSRLYRCDKEFVLEPLKTMLEVSEVFGLLVMDRKEATIGLLEGKRIELLQNMTSGIPSKVRAGGQCLSPDTRVYTEKKEIKIEQVKEGDFLQGFDFKKSQGRFNKVIKIWKTKKKELLEIFWKGDLNNSLKCSKDHLIFLRKNDKFISIPAGEINIGDCVIFSSGDYTPISKINSLKGAHELRDIEVENKNFLANGIIVHNSSQRFHRITEGLTRDFYKRIAEEMKKIFFEMPKLKGILIGGPIPTKDEFVDDEYMVTKLREKIIGRIDIGGSDESGLKELVEKSKDILADQEIVHEKKILEKFFETLGENPDLAMYKEKELRKALEFGAVDTLILSKDIDKKFSKELKKLAEGIGSNIEIVSTETEEGIQFKNLSGIGGILRFKI